MNKIIAVVTFGYAAFWLQCLAIVLLVLAIFQLISGNESYPIFILFGIAEYLALVCYVLGFAIYNRK